MPDDDAARPLTAPDTPCGPVTSTGIGPAGSAANTFTGNAGNTILIAGSTHSA